MATRRSFLAGLGIGLFSASAAWADPPGVVSMRGTASEAVDTVRRYVAFRATNEWTKAHTLLSPSAQPQPPFDQLLKADPSAGDPFARDLPSVLAAVSEFFFDNGNVRGYQYQVVGTAPEDPYTVLVSVQPHMGGTDESTKPLLLRIVTVPYTQAGFSQIDVTSSYQKTDPVYFEKARERARLTMSLSNLKQISLAMIIYVQDHDEKYPAAERWVDAITPYLVGTSETQARKQQILMSLFHDPSAPDSQKWSYAFNRNLSGLSLAHVDNPSITVCLFESNANAKNAADTGESIPRPGRHSGGNDYALADGHVKWVPDKMSSDDYRKSFSFSPAG